MTPDAAIRMTKHGRRLLRRGLLAPHDYTVLDCLVWSCRKPGASMTSVTYKALAGLCGMCRERAMQAVARLVALGRGGSCAGACVAGYGGVFRGLISTL
jgi:hypothetical protein